MQSCQILAEGDDSIFNVELMFEKRVAVENIVTLQFFLFKKRETNEPMYYEMSDELNQDFLMA